MGRSPVHRTSRNASTRESRNAATLRGICTDTVTSAVLGHLGLNFVIDVGAAGLLGLALAWMIWKKASWSAYFIAVAVIGVIDNAFLFTQVVPGYIELNAGSIGGPVIWAIACIVTPFGLPPLSTSVPSAQPVTAR